jgi:DUF4097 and DUF4098 domain-containing protein YvlB
MNPYRTRTIALATALLTTLTGAAGAGQASPQSWRGAIAQGNVIEIKGVNGDVRAVASSGGEVEVSAVMKGRRNNPSEVRLEIVQHAEGVTVCAMYPSPDSRPNECAPGNGGRMNVRDNDVTVDFTVRIPAGVRFSGRTVNGDVTAEGLSAPVSVRTVNGDVEFSTSSYGDAHTVNGSIRGNFGSTGWSDTVSFKTVNGSVTVALPADASADVKVTTVNGGISTAFPISVNGKVDPRRLNGTIGSGGRSLEIETVNGSVTLRKGS